MTAARWTEAELRAMDSQTAEDNAERDYAEGNTPVLLTGQEWLGLQIAKAEEAR